MDFELMIRRMTQMIPGDWLRVQMKHFALLWGEKTRFLRPCGGKRAELVRWLVITLFLMMTLGVGSMKAQDYSGTYYIAVHGNTNTQPGDYNSNSPETNYYLCPTEGWIFYEATDNFTTTDNGQPFLTSYKCKDGVYTANKAIWSIEKSGNYYKIIHAVDGKYLVANNKIGNANSGNRIRVHLQDTDPGNTALFTITKSTWNSSFFLISPRGNSGWYLNVTQGNQNSLQGTNAKEDGPEYTLNENTTRYVGGTIGLWNKDEHASLFLFEDAITIPTVTYSENDKNVTISSSQAGVRLYYTMTENGTEPSDPTSASDEYTTTPISTAGAKKYIIKAVAAMQIGSTTYYSRVKRQVVDRKVDPSTIATPISNLSGITDPSGAYYFSETFTATGSIPNNIGTSSNPFKGYIDGKMLSISPGGPLFECVEDAIIKNVIISSANIETGGDAGAIANVAKGDSRIYNCGVLAGSIGGDDNVGGIVGLLQGSSRVINCYSFANITGGDNVGGIVGNNDVTTASTKDDINTMIMNCMFYGNIEDGTNRSPIYGGTNITNDGNLNGYNYFLFDTDDENHYSQKASNQGGITKYNCALAAEKKYLTRFEFFRNVLNSTRELAAWYAMDDASKGRGVGAACEMAKWVLDASKPYPILKQQGYYSSPINYEDAPTFGSITLTINESNTTTGGQTKPNGASINSSYPTSLTVYDKDLTHKHYNYRTVRLPYYNQVGSGNCTHNRVVTGWKITGMTSGSQGSFTKNELDVTFTKDTNEKITGISKAPYNYADRSTYAKDLYIATSGDYSGRIFSQGAYFDVPDGVSGITIEPYWGTAVYLSDPTYDVAYPSGYGQTNAVFLEAMGTRALTINGDDQNVYTTFSTALNQISSSGTVYDNAIVLVGNYHHYWGQTSPSTSKAFTITSADLNNDFEPDYSFIVQHGTGRQQISSIRFDFINSPGLGMVQKVESDPAVPQHGIWHPKGWFEVTNTAIIQFSQFEYEGVAKTAGSPLILLGGIYDQFITSKEGIANTTEYIHLGSNVWMKEFCNGTHAVGTQSTRHIPISVTGGEFGSFYLSGTFNPDAAIYTDGAECYIDGGKFGTMAGAGQEQIKGNVVWLINNADITEFYGGGINKEKEITGNIYVEINNSNVGTYCGGPKFGDMHDDMVVITKAEGTKFDTFYGAGYGGTSYFRKNTKDVTGGMNFSGWLSDYTRLYTVDTEHNNKPLGIATEYETELIPYSGGQSGQANYVGRFYVKYASLSLARTKNVTSSLTNCEIAGDFFGGGNLGCVDGDVTSTLTNCKVKGSAYGAGFSANSPKVSVVPLGQATTYPKYNDAVGVITDGTPPAGVLYTWKHADAVSANNEFDEAGHILTTENLDDLGVVTGIVTLNIEGNTLVEGNVFEVDADGEILRDASGNRTVKEQSGGVFGGGDESGVTGDITVTINASDQQEDENHDKYNTYNVYGGGNKADVTGNAIVTLKGKSTVQNNIFGGGNKGAVSGSTTVNIQQ